MTTSSRQDDPMPPGPPPVAGAEAGATPQAGRFVDERIICFHEPHSEVVDYFRRFRAAITTAAGAQHKVLMFTSAVGGEGRSLTMANFAVVTCRDLGARIALVDCDLSRASTHELFDLPAEPGLSDVLSNGAALDQCLQQTPVDGLQLLPAGKKPINAAELLNSSRTDDVLKQLRERYDYVLLDGPAVLLSLEATLLGPRADGVILVIEAWQTPRARVQRAVELLERSRLLGFLLNRGQPELKR